MITGRSVRQTFGSIRFRVTGMEKKGGRLRANREGGGKQLDRGVSGKKRMRRVTNQQTVGHSYGKGSR